MKISDKSGYFTIEVAKLRGFNKNGRDDPPHYTALCKAANGDPNPKLDYIEYEEQFIASINDFKKAHTRKEVLNNEIQFIPGRTYTRIKTFKLNNTYFPINTIQDFRSREALMRRKDVQPFAKIALNQGLIQAIEAMKHNLITPKEEN